MKRRMTRRHLYLEPLTTTEAFRPLERPVICLNPREYRILRYSLTESADFSRATLAAVAQVIPVSVGRILTRLKNRGLIEIERGPNRRILSITPTFEFKKGEIFWVGNPLRKLSNSGTASKQFAKDCK